MSDRTGDEPTAHRADADQWRTSHQPHPLAMPQGEKPITVPAVLQELRSTNAFREIKHFQVDRETLELTIARTCAVYLAKFKDDHISRQAVEILAEKKSVLAAACQDLRGLDMPQPHLEDRVSALNRAIELARLGAGLSTRRRWLEFDKDGEMVLKESSRTLAAARLERDATHLDRLTVDLCLVLRRMTGMSLNGILCMALPPILEGLSLTYGETNWLPKRGLRDPEAKFKRFMSKSLRTLRRDHPKITRRALMEMRERLLLQDPDIFLPQT